MSRSLPRFIVFVALVACAASLVVGCGGQQGTQQEAPAPAPETATPPEEGAAPQDGGPASATAGSALVDEYCTRCHDRGRVDAASYDREGWQQTVQRMKTNGLEISPDDETAIIDYLASRDN